MKYDDAGWHSGGDFPSDLPAEAGATHIGMYLAWLLLQGMASEELAEDAEEDLQALLERRTTPSLFLLECSDGKFVDDLISDEPTRSPLRTTTSRMASTWTTMRDSWAPMSRICTTSPIPGRTSIDWHR